MGDCFDHFSQALSSVFGQEVCFFSEVAEEHKCCMVQLFSFLPFLIKSFFLHIYNSKCSVFGTFNSLRIIGSQGTGGFGDPGNLAIHRDPNPLEGVPADSKGENLLSYQKCGHPQHLQV